MRAHHAGHRHHFLVGLEILEPGRALERKFDLVGIEHVEHDHVGPAELEVLQPAHNRFGIVEQIGNQHDHAALGQRVAELIERPGHVRLFTEPQPIERHEDGAQMPGPRAGRKHVDDALVERHQADRVALPRHQICERRGEARAVLELGHRARPVRHRSADVEHEMAIEIGLLLELLDVVPIAACVHLPVDRRQIVARHVLPVLRELDAEAFEGAAM